MTVALAFQIVAFILDRGLPAWVALSRSWAKKDPTMSDFESLKNMMKRPEEF